MLENKRSKRKRYATAVEGAKNRRNEMKIQVNQIEGKSLATGAKQNKVYTITGNSGFYTDYKGEVSDLTNFHHAEDEKGKKYTIWDVARNWSKIGISREGYRRMSYTENFTVIP